MRGSPRADRFSPEITLLQIDIFVAMTIMIPLAAAHEIEFGDRSRMRRHRFARPFIFSGRIIVNFDREMRSRRPPTPPSSPLPEEQYCDASSCGRGVVAFAAAKMRHGDAASRELRSRTVDSLIAPASRDYQESEGFLNCALSSGKPTRLRQLMLRRALDPSSATSRFQNQFRDDGRDSSRRCTLTPSDNKEKKFHRNPILEIKS